MTIDAVMAAHSFYDPLVIDGDGHPVVAPTAGAALEMAPDVITTRWT